MKSTISCTKFLWGILLGLLGIVAFSPLSLSSPALSSLDLENLSSAELEELLGQLTAQEIEAAPHVPGEDLARHHLHQQVLSQETLLHHPEEPSRELFNHGIDEVAIPGASSSVHIINDCMTISMEEGVFHYKSQGTSEQVCGLYLLSDPDKSIVVTVDYLDVDCKRGGLISVVDGWELNGQVFPGVDDHEKSLAARFHEMCGNGRRVQQRFTSSQNAAVIQYRIPVMAEGFSIRVKHIRNQRPCNILVQDTRGEYTLQNYGKRVNCSLTTLFDAKIKLMYLSTDGRRGSSGSGLKYTRAGIERGLVHKCEKRGIADYVQIGGSTGLETSKMDVVQDLCGHGGLQGMRPTTIFCGMTTVRLVSSGTFSNKVTVQVQKAGLDDLDDANHICGM